VANQRPVDRSVQTDARAEQTEPRAKPATPPNGTASGASAAHPDVGTASGASVGAVVLAAGAATRFGSPKQRLLLPEVLERLRRTAVDEVVVVLGAYDVETDARVVRCADWELGPGASLRCGLEALDAEAVVVVLADGPDLAPEAVERVIAAWREHGEPVVAASYSGERGHPVLLARSAWGAVPDEGARGLPALLVPCDDLGAPGDVDRADQLPERFR
jgi:CTP:molybdopterin cytidylyltransferase MocA